MIKIGFMTSQRKVIKFVIDNRVVYYYDDIWKKGIQIMPSQTPEMKMKLLKMLNDRRPAIQATGTFIVDANSGKNKEEYDACDTDEELADLIRKDCKDKQLTEIKHIGG